MHFLLLVCHIHLIGAYSTSCYGCTIAMIMAAKSPKLMYGRCNSFPKVD
jgi:hypothetical protein